MSVAWNVTLPPVEKLVLLALADWANDDGACWPSIKKLVEKTDASERTVQRAISSLASKGQLTRSEVSGKGVNYTIHPRHIDTPVTVTPASERRDTPVTVTPNTSGIHQPSEAKASKGNARSSDFETFWDAYPRKVGKLAALAAWKRLKPPLVTALAAIARYRQTKPADIDFCHPATWLNQGRWMDEHGEATGPPVTVDPARVAAMTADFKARQRAYLDELDAADASH